MVANKNPVGVNCELMSNLNLFIAYGTVLKNHIYVTTIKKQQFFKKSVNRLKTS